MKINWKGLILWSNHFYGICAVLLAIESNFILIQKMPNLFLLLFIHLATVVYYTHAYLQEVHDGVYNERTTWYHNNARYLIIRQIVFTCIGIWIGLFKLDILNLFYHTTLWVKFIMLLSIFISVIYYLPKYSIFSLNIFRHIGILKSISIAWVWTIISCVFPIWLELHKNFTHILTTYFFWNHFTFIFLFILILAILFDIKDLYRDQKEFVNTIVARFGIDFTIHKIILPLLCILFLFVLVGFILQVNSGWQFIINLFILGLTYHVARKVINYNAIHTNLLMIDGLIILKAISGIILSLIMLKS